MKNKVEYKPIAARCFNDELSIFSQIDINTNCNCPCLLITFTINLICSHSTLFISLLLFTAKLHNNFINSIEAICFDSYL